MPSELAELLQNARHTLDWDRRSIAAVLAGLAVLASLAALAPKRPPARMVWTAAHDLAGGAAIRAADVVASRLPLTAVPAGALQAGSTVIGRLLAAPVRRGEPLTDVRLLGPSLLAALPTPGLVAVPVRVADGPAAAALVKPGDLVDVLQVTDPADGGSRLPATVASRVEVLAVPSAASADGAGLVVLAATQNQAGALAQASAGARLSLALQRP